MPQQTHVTCPHCNNVIDIEELIAHDVEERLREQLRAGFEAERDRLVREESERVQNESAATIESLRRENQERKQALEGLRELEVRHLELTRQHTEQQQNFDLELRKRVLEEQTAMETKVRSQEAEKYALERRRETERFDLERRELQKRLDDTQRAADEFKRKAEQGSQQLQGEIQEIAIEDYLRQQFPFDVISPVAKGQRGADCVQSVNEGGRICGTIIYESKRTKQFSMEWVEKLKANMRAADADIGVIVTETMPKDTTSFTQISGVWICTMTEFRSLVAVLRDMLVRVSAAVASQENKGDKMTMLYDYLMSTSFRLAVENVMEAFVLMKSDITRERTAMEKMWRQREKQLERMSLSMAGVMGSISGIAGADLGPIPTFELPSNTTDETPTQP